MIRRLLDALTGTDPQPEPAEPAPAPVEAESEAADDEPTATICVACTCERPHSHCICCDRRTTVGLLCHDCAKPDPERVQELRERDGPGASARRRRNWMIEARSS